MGGLAACAGGAGIGALAFLALRGLLAFGAFFSKARKARSARSVAARSVASATRQFSLAAADLLRTLAVGGRGGSGSASERRKAFVAGKYSSVGRSRRDVLAIFLWNFLQTLPCRGLRPHCGINFLYLQQGLLWGRPRGLLGPAACARALAVESSSLCCSLLWHSERVWPIVGQSWPK